MLGLILPAGGNHFETSLCPSISSAGWKLTVHTGFTGGSRRGLMPCLYQGFNSLLKPLLLHSVGGKVNDPEIPRGLASYTAFLGLIVVRVGQAQQ